MNLPPVYVGKRALWLSAVIACGLVQAACVIASAFVIQLEVDAIISQQKPGETLRFLFVMSGIAALAGASIWAERYLLELLGQHYVDELRRGMFSALASMTPEQRAREHRGLIPLRFVTDLNALRQWISLGQARLVVAGMLLCGTMAYLATIGPLLALVVFGILLVNGAVTLVLGQRLESAVRVSRRRRGRLSAMVAAHVSGLASIVASGRVHSERNRLLRRSGALVEAMRRRAFWSGALRASSELGVRGAMIAVLAISLMAVDAGTASVGTILAAISVVALLATPVRDMGRAHEYWQAGRVAQHKVRQFLSRPSQPMPARTDVVLTRNGSLQVRDLQMRSGHAGFDADLDAGARVLLAGENGAGKTRLLWTIAGLAVPFRGEILVDGHAPARLRSRSLQQSIGIASPDLPLQAGTLGRNLRYRAPSASTLELERVAAITGLDAMLESGEGLLDLRLTGSDLELSSGQRARIQLARALVDSPSVLLLDEIDAFLDEDGRQQLTTVLASYPGIVIFTSHDARVKALASIVWRIGGSGIERSDSDSPAAPRRSPPKLRLHRNTSGVAAARGPTTMEGCSDAS